MEQPPRKTVQRVRHELRMREVSVARIETVGEHFASITFQGEALAEALSDFDGAIVMVSHDRHLIGLVCDSFWRVADGVVEPFDGDLDEFVEASLKSGLEAGAKRSDAA